MKELKYLLKGLAFFACYTICFLLLIKTLWFPLLVLILGGCWLLGRVISEK